MSEIAPKKERRWRVILRRESDVVVTGEEPKEHPSLPHMVTLGQGIFQKQDIVAMIAIPSVVKEDDGSAGCIDYQLAADLKRVAVAASKIPEAATKKELEVYVGQIKDALRRHIHVDGAARDEDDDLPF